MSIAVAYDKPAVEEPALDDGTISDIDRWGNASRGLAWREGDSPERVRCRRGFSPRLTIRRLRCLAGCEGIGLVRSIMGPAHDGATSGWPDGLESSDSSSISFVVPRRCAVPEYCSFCKFPSSAILESEWRPALSPSLSSQFREPPLSPAEKGPVEEVDDDAVLETDIIESYIYSVDAIRSLYFLVGIETCLEHPVSSLAWSLRWL